MTDLLEGLRDAHRRGGVEALAAEAERCMPPESWRDPGRVQSWVDELIAGCSDPKLSVPASWLLLQHGRTGRSISAGSVAMLARASLSTDVGPDDARLHLAQLVQYLDVPVDSVEAFASFLLRGCESKHAFLRAWAIDGLYRLSLHHSQCIPLAERALSRGTEDPKASVRARVRRIEVEAARRG